MKTKDIKAFSVCLLLALTFTLVTCGESPVGDGPGTLSGYRVVFHVGEGQGVAPFPQTVAPGNIIELPGQENMTHSAGKVLSSWKTGSTTYKPYYRYTVNKDVEFTAQWSASTTTPGGTTPGGTDPGGTTPGGTTPGGSDPGTTSDGSIIVPGSSLAEKLVWMNANAKSNTSYVLEVSANETIIDQNLYYSGKRNITITIRGVGANRTLSLSSNSPGMFRTDSVTLVLDNIILRGRDGRGISNLIIIGYDGTLIMNAGSAITGHDGRGVYIWNGANFTMNGGTISDNVAPGGDSGGGGVCVSGGTFTMNGGTISGNSSFGARGGGGVSVESGTFTMNGGTISGNTTERGGGVYVGGATFIMTGGTITGNSAREQGGGVNINGSFGSFTKTGGTITGYDSDQGNGNMVKSRYGNVLSDRGHAVFADSKIRKETTAGPGDNLSYTRDGSFGAWDY